MALPLTFDPRHEKRVIDDLSKHVGHELTVSRYAGPVIVWNVSIECLDCSEVLFDVDVADEEGEDG